MDQRVRDGLSISLGTLFERLGEQLNVIPAEAQKLVEAIRTGVVAPSLVAIYSDLVEAIYAEDTPRAEALAAAILKERPPANALQVATLSDDDLGPGQVERFIRYGFEDSLQTTFAPVPPDAHHRIAASVEEVMALLGDAAPEIAAEMRAIVRQVVLVGAPPQGGFGGASSFYLWGAMLLNAQRLTGRLPLAMAMIHETAHGFLFGVNLGEPLTSNDPEALCVSPLRADPRPVEGVFHATFVLARMIYGLDRLRSSDRLTAEEAVWVERETGKCCKDFAEGLRSLAPIAVLTSEGSQLLAGATAYVASAHP